MSQIPQPAKKILIVDDNRDCADALATLVRLKGHLPVVTYDALSGLDTADWMIPDIIFLDLAMPGMDGYKAAQRLRSDVRFENAVLVAYSACDQPSDRERAALAGYDVYMSKPIDCALLDRILSQAADATKIEAGKEIDTNIVVTHEG